MALTTTTPLMSLVLPVPGPNGQIGPTWAQNLIDALTTVDSHNHSSGSGSRITPGGININQDLTFSDFNATSLNSSRYTSLSATLASSADKNCVYVVSGDLYYNNGSGTAVQLTSAGAINVAALGTITGDYSSSGAAVSYNNTVKAYSFLQGTPDTSIYGAMVCGNVAITEQVSGGNSVTLQAATGLAAAYSLTLPAALPGAGTKILTVSSTGQVGDAYDVDGTTLEVSSNALRVKDSGISTAKIADGSVTQAKRAAIGQQISSGSGSFSTFSSGSTDVTNLSVTITTTGRLVDIRCIPDASYFDVSTFGSSGAGVANIYIVRGSTTIFKTKARGNSSLPPSAAMTVDPVAAGTYTYKVQMASPDGSAIFAEGIKLVAFEL